MDFRASYYWVLNGTKPLNGDLDSNWVFIGLCGCKIGPAHQNDIIGTHALSFDLKLIDDRKDVYMIYSIFNTYIHISACNTRLN